MTLNWLGTPFHEATEYSRHPSSLIDGQIPAAMTSRSLSPRGGVRPVNNDPQPRLGIGVDNLDHPAPAGPDLGDLLDHPVTDGPVEVPHLIDTADQLPAGRS